MERVAGGPRLVRCLRHRLPRHRLHRAADSIRGVRHVAVLEDDPTASAMATAMVCLLTSSPTNRIRSDMGLVSNDVALSGVCFIHPGNPRCSLRRPPAEPDSFHAD
jgi:hypothetical protein